MRKLQLDLSSLRVESFEPRAGPAPVVGTVRANSGDPIEPSGEESCAPTICVTCLCPRTSPQPSCEPCSWWDVCLPDDPPTDP